MTDGSNSDDDQDEHNGDYGGKGEDSDSGSLLFGPTAGNASSHHATERRRLRRDPMNTRQKTTYGIVFNFFFFGRGRTAVAEKRKPTIKKNGGRTRRQTDRGE